MKTFLLILLIYLISGCHTGKPKSSFYNQDSDTITVTELPITGGCDSLKFPGFKTNLKEVILPGKEIRYLVDSISEAFIKSQCNQDSLFCDPVFLKDQKHFSSDSYHLFAFAYSFREGDSTLEKESASFFVFGIIQNGKMIFHDIVHDLAGEIQFMLKGLETQDDEIIIWGEMYPYFSSKDYGKFKLTVNGEEKEYGFQCSSKDTNRKD